MPALRSLLPDPALPRPPSGRRLRCADIRATADAPTPVNVFSHPYFNLAGVRSNDSSVLDHLLAVNARYYQEVDDGGAATGAFVPLAGTPLDFGGAPRAIGERINGAHAGCGLRWRLVAGGSRGVRARAWEGEHLGRAPRALHARQAAARRRVPSHSLPPPALPPAGAETAGGYGVSYLLGGLTPDTAADVAAFQTSEE